MDEPVPGVAVPPERAAVDGHAGREGGGDGVLRGGAVVVATDKAGDGTAVGHDRPAEPVLLLEDVDHQGFVGAARDAVGRVVGAHDAARTPKGDGSLPRRQVPCNV